MLALKVHGSKNLIEGAPEALSIAVVRDSSRLSDEVRDDFLRRLHASTVPRVEDESPPCRSTPEEGSEILQAMLPEDNDACLLCLDEPRNVEAARENGRRAEAVDLSACVPGLALAGHLEETFARVDCRI